MYSALEKPFSCVQYDMEGPLLWLVQTMALQLELVIGMFWGPFTLGEGLVQTGQPL